MRRRGEVGTGLERGALPSPQLPPPLGARLGSSALRPFLWSFFCFFFFFFSFPWHFFFSPSSIVIRGCALPREGPGGLA